MFWALLLSPAHTLTFYFCIFVVVILLFLFLHALGKYCSYWNYLLICSWLYHSLISLSMDTFILTTIFSIHTLFFLIYGYLFLLQIEDVLPKNIYCKFLISLLL